MTGNLGAGWLLHRGVPRVMVIVGATLSMSLCAAGIFVNGVPDLARLVLAGLYSAVIGVVPGALFTAIPIHAPRRELAGANSADADSSRSFQRRLGGPPGGLSGPRGG